MKDKILACLNCDFQIKWGELEHPHISFNLCPKCKEKNLIPLKDYEKIKEDEEKSKYLYCQECGKIDLIENFPFDDPTDEYREKYCPECLNRDSIINLSNVKFCSNCKTNPVAKNDNWCEVCISETEDRTSYEYADHFDY